VDWNSIDCENLRYMIKNGNTKELHGRLKQIMRIKKKGKILQGVIQGEETILDKKGRE
jgi:hypothetical protein